MSFICLICKDLLTSESDYKVDDDSSSPCSVIITTKCGHLYHKDCIQQFFIVQRKDEEDNGRRTSPTLCPACKRVVIIENTIQIYPDEDEMDQNDMIYKLRKQRSELQKENVKLKTENENLMERIKYLEGKPGSNLDADTTHNSLTNLKGAKVVWFSGSSEEAIEGIVQRVENRDKILRAKILFNEEDVRWIPVAQLIMHTDYYYGAESTEDPQEQCTTTSHFLDNKYNVAIFYAELNSATSVLNSLQEDVGIFASEHIDGVPFHIEKQIEKATNLRRQLIHAAQAIIKLQSMQCDISEKLDATEEGKNRLAEKRILQLENDRHNSLDLLKQTSRIYSAALPQVQKIRAFIRAGFVWLDALENKMGDMMAMDFNEESRVNAVFISLDQEIKSRAFTIESVNQAIETFLAIPNSKLPQTDKSIFTNAFTRFKNLEQNFHSRNYSRFTFTLQNMKTWLAKVSTNIRNTPKRSPLLEQILKDTAVEGNKKILLLKFIAETLLQNNSNDKKWIKDNLHAMETDWNRSVFMSK